MSDTHEMNEGMAAAQSKLAAVVDQLSPDPDDLSMKIQAHRHVIMDHLSMGLPELIHAANEFITIAALRGLDPSEAAEQLDDLWRGLSTLVHGTSEKRGQ